MNRNYKLFLKDIEESINQIERYCERISEEQFKKDTKLQDAVVRRLERIGEASEKIPRNIRQKNKEIPWSKISMFRDFIVHSYFEASLNRVWITIKEDLPKIKENLKKIKLL